MEQRTERHVNILSVYPGSDNGLESEQACCPGELKWCTESTGLSRNNVIWMINLRNKH